MAEGEANSIQLLGLKIRRKVKVSRQNWRGWKRGVARGGGGEDNLLCDKLETEMLVNPKLGTFGAGKKFPTVCHSGTS